MERMGNSDFSAAMNHYYKPSKSKLKWFTKNCIYQKFQNLFRICYSRKYNKALLYIYAKKDQSNHYKSNLD